VSGVRMCLTWVYVTTAYLDDDPRAAGNIDNYSASLRISRLSTLFLAAPDLFLDREVNRLARACLWDTLGRARNPRVRFDESTIPGIESFGEFYSELISQFESVSYGDSLFALVVLLPTNSRNPVKNREKLWSDHREALRSITLKCEQLPAGLTPQDFVGQESEMDLIKIQVSVLLNGEVHPKRNELLCRVAVLGLRNYFKKCTSPAQDIQSALEKLKAKNQELYHDILD